jgi:hypothetical protein
MSVLTLIFMSKKISEPRLPWLKARDIIKKQLEKF